MAAPAEAMALHPSKAVVVFSVGVAAVVRPAAVLVAKAAASFAEADLKAVGVPFDFAAPPRKAGCKAVPVPTQDGSALTFFCRFRGCRCCRFCRCGCCACNGCKDCGDGGCNLACWGGVGGIEVTAGGGGVGTATRAGDGGVGGKDCAGEGVGGVGGKDSAGDGGVGGSTVAATGGGGTGMEGVGGGGHGLCCASCCGCCQSSRCRSPSFFWRSLSCCFWNQVKGNCVSLSSCPAVLFAPDHVGNRGICIKGLGAICTFAAFEGCCSSELEGRTLTSRCRIRVSMFLIGWTGAGGGGGCASACCFCRRRPI